MPHDDQAIIRPALRPAPTPPRAIGAINWIGLRTLCAKEVERFMKVHTQTILAPIVTFILFLVVFGLAFGGTGRGIGGVHFLVFLAPGLIMMAIIQNAFANTTSSIMIAKVQGNIVDVLMPPLSPGELTLGFAFGGVARGMVVGVTVALSLAAVLAFVAPLPVHDALAILYFSVGASLMLALFGIIVAVLAIKFDFIAGITNFVITPLAFLSGTFYSVERLPGVFYLLSHANPFFYLIDGLRYGFIGHADGSLLAGVLVVAGLNVALWIACHVIFARGYRLKA
ncbi:MAG: multidrug ABC transporter permease [Alphaproteobacteria bacterium]|nr:multidrug ABC transporter permease [Alphaproteobacteria bacterium]